jgi:glycosyltransferase involved in cell wall biosynthesis
MRLAYVCADPGVPVFGRKGSSIHVQEVIRALQARGAEVELFATRFDGDVPRGLEQVRLHRLPVIPKLPLPERERAAYRSNEDLRLALEMAGSFDVVYERYSLWSFAGMAYARTHGIPGLLEVNAPLIEEQLEHRGLHDLILAQSVALQVFAQASTILAVSESVAAHLETHSEAIHKVQVVPNGVDPRRFPLDLEPSWSMPERFVVGFVGTLKPWHGLNVLVDAFAQLHAHAPEARLLIVGDGPERAALEERLRGHGVLEATHFTGALDAKEIPGVLASMDVAVAPYPKLERFYFSPLKIYEYMAAGVAVIASDIGQIASVIEPERTGLLCEPGSVSSLRLALERLRSDDLLRHRLGRQARRQALEHHTWDAVAGRILELAGLQRLEVSA